MVHLTQEAGGALLSLSNDLAGAVERAGGATVAVNARQRMASSGIHWRQGVVVTADHTVERDEEITVTLANGKSMPATLAGRDPSTDLAVLRVEGIEAPIAHIGDAAGLKVGHLVIAIGRPGEDGLAASMGAVSALGGPWRTWRGGHVGQFIRPDLTLYPGFSGGPLADAQGQVVGLVTSGLSRGAGLAIPAATVTAVVEQILAKGHIARGYLGLGMQPVHLPDDLKARLSLPANQGLIVVSVGAGGPAEQGGLLIGDVLVALDGAPVADTNDVQTLLGPERVGKPITVQVVRGGAATQVTVTVGERPQKED